MELSNEEKEREFTCGLQKCKGGEGTEIDQDYKELDLHMLHLLWRNNKVYVGPNLQSVQNRIILFIYFILKILL